MSKPRKAKTHFVPRAVYRTAFAGVVPICVAGLACGGSTVSGSSSDGGDDGGNPTSGDAAQDAKDEGPPVFSVACSFAQCGVGVQAFADGGDSG